MKLNGASEQVSEPAMNEGLARDDILPNVEDEKRAAANKLTKEVYETINSKGEIFLTSGVVNGIYAIRVVSANPKAEEKYLRKAFEILVDTAETCVKDLRWNAGPR